VTAPPKPKPVATVPPKPKPVVTVPPKPKPVVTAKPKPVATAAPVPVAKEFDNCTDMRQTYPHGVGRPGARDKTSGTPVTSFKVSSALYEANTKSDGDGDGIACEQH
jgi:hypothetical protein